jgi:hypothetical protein
MLGSIQRAARPFLREGLVEGVLLVLGDIGLRDHGCRHDHLPGDLRWNELAEILAEGDQAEMPSCRAPGVEITPSIQPSIVSAISCQPSATIIRCGRPGNST